MIIIEDYQIRQIRWFIDSLIIDYYYIIYYWYWGTDSLHEKEIFFDIHEGGK